MRQLVCKKEQTLLKFVRSMFPALTESMLRRALRQRDLRVNGVRTGTDVCLHGGDIVEVYIDDRYLTPSVPVLYQDDRILVADKPAGIAVEGAGGLCALLAARLGAPLYPVHRLDVPTRGIVLMAKTPDCEKALLALFKDRMLTKQYQCIVLGAPPKRQGIVETGLNKNPKTALVTVCAPHAPGAKIAKTGYSVLDTREGRSLLKIDLFTGRTHQIRVHMAYLGCPILGDDKYGDRMANRRYGADQLSLCASYLALHPQSGPLRDLAGHVFKIDQPFEKEWNQ